MTTLLISADPNDKLFFQLAVNRIQSEISCEFLTNGIHALEKLSCPEFNPDIIFIAINMPVLNGIECLREIKKIKRLDAIPVYMYSTSSDAHIAQSCLQLGADGVMKKFPGIELLKDSLNEIFEELHLPAGE